MSDRIPVRNPNEIAKLRKAGEVAARILMDLMPEVVAGRTTREIDEFAAELFKRERCGNAFLGYGGFPGQLCISVNEEVIHGIGGDRVIRDGDVVSLDVGTIVDGWYGDNAMTVPVGQVDPDTLKLLAVTEESLFRAIAEAKQGGSLADVCGAVEDFVKPFGFGIVRDFVGHGVGRHLHEEPNVPNYRPNHKLPRLKRGMVLAIEPMVNAGTFRVKVLDDKWTTVTADGKPSAHFEHTVAVSSHGGEILTERPRIALPEQLGIAPL
ncbi:type I methionyl aminopeptidase [Akkermansia glycaniphila]|uniref:Methionine aminopeptidase n=1 Tax=Akkermansia glycaniphila TaxID=1679444 RepID=A0A1C7PD26_9BACT|nr:type I methionyl aminopeptidase [Akkermansia glycaniphila]MBT9448516.1 type I methionyl aminopeptidase [Akkermansia glycaniphila]OCA03294.1 methionine aminopeptidase [Akkermansia glycaniphila]SEH81085.1 met pdase i: methionine aminopeptidase type i [Akkermansia glycaniphila]